MNQQKAAFSPLSNNQPEMRRPRKFLFNSFQNYPLFSDQEVKSNSIKSTRFYSVDQLFPGGEKGPRRDRAHVG